MSVGNPYETRVEPMCMIDEFESDPCGGPQRIGRHLMTLGSSTAPETSPPFQPQAKFVRISSTVGIDGFHGVEGQSQTPIALTPGHQLVVAVTPGHRVHVRAANMKAARLG